MGISVIFRIAPILAFVFLLAVSSAARAESEKPEAFSASVEVSGPFTLQSDRYAIEIWGLERNGPQNPVIAARARALLERRIETDPVSCRVQVWAEETPYAQCTNSAGDDLGIALLEAGYAVADRKALHGTLQKEPYLKTEYAAMEAGRGLWQTLAQTGKDQAEEFIASPQNQVFLILGVGAGLALTIFFGFLLVVLTMGRGFRKLVTFHTKQAEDSRVREEKMRRREKYVLAVSLTGELSANLTKIEAFLSIYNDTLKTLRDPSKTPKYQKTGDVIHLCPELARSVYDSNTDKLDLLGMDLVVDITALYAEVQTETDYKTIEPDTPIESVLRDVEKIIREAERLVRPTERVLSALDTILRDRQRKSREDNSVPKLKRGR